MTKVTREVGDEVERTVQGWERQRDSARGMGTCKDCTRVGERQGWARQCEGDGHIQRGWGDARMGR